MIKLQATQPRINELNEIEEISETVYLHYSAKAVMNYETQTGRSFFEDYSTAVQALDLDELNAKDMDKLSVSDGLSLLTNKDINEFMLYAIPALYARIVDGRFVQNDITYNEAKDSDWLIELVNIETFALLINEISKNSTNKSQASNGKKN